MFCARITVFVLNVLKFVYGVQLINKCCNGGITLAKFSMLAGACIRCAHWYTFKYSASALGLTVSDFFNYPNLFNTD